MSRFAANFLLLLFMLVFFTAGYIKGRVDNGKDFQISIEAIK